MNTHPAFEPFHHGMTIPQPGEDDLLTEIDATLESIRETTFENSGHAIRSVHAKSHGLITAELEVSDALPEILAQGLFGRPGLYPVVMRFSTNPGDILPDSVSTPRGLAIKILDVDGERLPGDAELRSQDFVMVNGPTFSAPDGRAFAKNLAMLAATTDRGEGLKVALSAALRGIERVVEAMGSESPTLKSLGGHPWTHILGETFFTQLPMRYGDYIAKLSVAPASDNLRALKDEPLERTDDDDFIRNAVRDFFAREDAEWEVRVQLCTNLDDMPIEPANIPWDEDKSPYLPVGRLRTVRQEGWSADRAAVVDDGMGFSPWHGIVDHWPLGSLMRIRQQTYANSQLFRSQRNVCPVHEPRDANLP